MNLAIKIFAPLDIRLTETEMRDPLAGEVLLGMERGGICGSDLHYFHHGGVGAVKLRAPMILGHEVSARVLQRGSGVEHLQIGDLVAVNPSTVCGKCEFCFAGLPNHCRNSSFLGSAMRLPHCDGAFRQFLTIRSEQCVPADGLTPEAAAMAEPLAVCLHGLQLSGGVLGKRVLVTGCGPIGLLCIQLARQAGAVEITAADVAPDALSRARKLGADKTLDVTPESGAPVGTSAGPRHYADRENHYHVHFECSGAASAVQTGVVALRPRGTIVQIGMGSHISVPMDRITAKELRLLGSFRFGSAFREAVALMLGGVVDVNAMVTHQFAPLELQQAFATASNRAIANKVQIDFTRQATAAVPKPADRS